MLVGQIMKTKSDTKQNPLTDVDFDIWNFLFMKAHNDILFLLKTNEDFWSADSSLNAIYEEQYSRLFAAYLNEAVLLIKAAKEVGFFEKIQNPLIDKLCDFLLTTLDSIVINQEQVSFHEVILRKERNSIFHYIEKADNKARTRQFEKMKTCFSFYRGSLKEHFDVDSVPNFHKGATYYTQINEMFGMYLFLKNNTDEEKTDEFLKDYYRKYYDALYGSIICCKDILELVTYNYVATK